MSATAPLPPPLMTSEPGSFARRTIVERKPEIIARVIADNAYPPPIVAALEDFRDEITRRPVQPLREAVGEAAFWRQQWARYEGRTWLELPWYFAETFFYRRLLEAVRYFQLGPWMGLDPFRGQKRAQEADAVEQLSEIWPAITAIAPQERFTPLLHACLWGNRADLSNFTVREQAVGDTTADRANILIDHTDEVRALMTPGLDHIAFVNDNVGADSLFDLILADHLLARGWTQRVTFHLKAQPFFVSDAMPPDIRTIIQHLRTAAADGLAALGERLSAALTSGALTLTTHPFWTLALGFRALPDALRDRLAQADLTILKGDVNYRRLLEDRHWPPDASMAEAAPTFPRPYLILRTLKGEIIVGLEPGQAEALQAQDPDWLINGKRGIIQLVSDGV